MTDWHRLYAVARSQLAGRLEQERMRRLRDADPNYCPLTYRCGRRHYWKPEGGYHSHAAS